MSIVATSPDGTVSRRLWPLSVEFEGAINEPSTLVFSLRNDYDLLEAESASGPLQENSKIVFTYQGVALTFFVWSREMTDDYGREITVKCLDRMAKLNDTLAAIDGEPLFTRTTPPLDITQETLVKSPAIGTALYPFWPVITSDAWLHNNGGAPNSTTLGADITGTGAVSIKAATSSGGMLPRGFVQIDTEWIYYDGYNRQDDGFWYFEVDAGGRGIFGTTAATHTAGATINQRISQKIHPTRAIQIEGFKDAAWHPIPSGEFAVQVEEGRFDFARDPLAVEYSDLRATYAVFNETNVSAVGLAGIVQEVLEEPQATGGPEWAGMHDISISPDISLTRVHVTEPMKTRDFIQRLLDETGLMKGAATDALGWWWDHTQNKLAVKTLAQAETPDYTFTGAVRRFRDYALEDVYSAVLVKYTESQELNLLAADRMYHPARGGETVGSNAVEIYAYRWNTGGGTWEESQSGVSNQVNTFYIVDGKDASGQGLIFDGNPGTNVDALWAWFPGAATMRIEKIRAVFDFSRSSQAANPVGVEIMGVAAINTGDPPLSTGEFSLSGGLVKNYPAAPGGGLDSQKQVEFSADGIGAEAQGILVRYTSGVPTDRSGNRWWHGIKELKVTGKRVLSVLVQITDQIEQSAEYLYAPESYAKLRSGDFDEPRVLQIDIGEASENAAISLGRLALEATLSLWQQRDYELVNANVLPEIGDTVEFSEDSWSGIVLARSLSMQGGSEVLTLTCIDYLGGEL